MTEIINNEEKNIEKMAFLYFYVEVVNIQRILEHLAIAEKMYM